MDELVRRGITALEDYLGKDNVAALLGPSALRTDEAAAFYYPLPVDYSGVERQLRIGFPKKFPSESLRLQVEPSPWLIWPHAMESGFCLYGFKERPVTGTPEKIIQESFVRLARIISLSLENSDPLMREEEFQSEISSYWSRQQKKSARNLTLLGNPENGVVLYVVSDPRYFGPSGYETVWMSSDKNAICQHYRRSTGRSVVIRNPHKAGFFVKLNSFPDIRIPEPKDFINWLSPHIFDETVAALSEWMKAGNTLTSRWIVMELPGPPGAARYTLNLCTRKMNIDRSPFFGLRSARRKPATEQGGPPASILSARMNVIDRNEIFSRDKSNTVASLSSAHVILVGVGSLGSGVAVQLVRAGLGKLTLIDPDRLESANLGRHILGADDLGIFKSTALRNRLLQDMPILDITAFDTYAEIIMEHKPALFDSADLIIITTADWESESVIWARKASGAKWGMIQAWSEPHTLVGHALVAPGGGDDARYLFNETGDFSHRFSDWPDGGVVPLPACGESYIPGGASGMSGVATMVSQAAVRFLTFGDKEPQWYSSVYRPDEAQIYGGRYTGPELPEGVIQCTFQRHWPNAG